MNQTITPSSLLRQWFICAVFLLFYAGVNAQSASAAISGTGSADGFQWKSPATITLILQQELTQTNNALLQPNLTDWSEAMLKGYRSLLTFTQAQMQIQGSQKMTFVVDKALELTLAESVQLPLPRAMVADDLKATKIELVQKLTNQ